MAYEKMTAALAALKDASDRAIAKIASEQANSSQAMETVAQAQADAAAADDNLSGQVQAITNALTAAAPADPANQPTA